jgi:Family of unknown function (DUF6221)
VLSSVAAHRKIIELHSGPFGGDRADRHVCEDSVIDDDDCPVLRALASIYARHPDYRTDWA